MAPPRPKKPLADVQGMRPEIPLELDSVGISALRLRVLAPEAGGQWQSAAAICALGASLSADRRGAHMSRFVEALEAWDRRLGWESIRALLDGVRLRLDSSSASASFAFPFFMRKKAPFGAESELSYDCGLSGILGGEGYSLAMSLEIPAMTVCPCSRAICDEGAHSQRARIRMRLQLRGLPHFEDLIALGEASASAPLHSLLKREDEKLVTETAFRQAAFVEDVARKAASLLRMLPAVKSYEAEVESMESIHSHNAFARVAGPGPQG